MARAMTKATEEARQRKEMLAKLKNENSMGSAQVTAQLAAVNMSGRDLSALASAEEISPEAKEASPEDEEVELDNTPTVAEGHYIISYGPKTIDYIC